MAIPLVRALGEATISGTTANGNFLSGATSSTGGAVTGNVANRNGEHGLTCGSTCLVSGNTTYANGLDGLRCGFNCALLHNSTSNSGRDQLWANQGSLIQGNAVRVSNGAWGMNLQHGSVGYRENVVTTFNASGGAVTGGTNLGNNLCDSSLIC